VSLFYEQEGEGLIMAGYKDGTIKVWGEGAASNIHSNFSRSPHADKHLAYV
jgi:hypothetical protein